ncbi:MAG: hypothetical protein F6K47_41375 [Symploca sp. SIO2E6]|nr:hypothetical protein [Symploca sp. SIO2E6]
MGPNGKFSATNPQDSQLLAIQPGVLFDNNRAANYGEIKSFADLDVPAGQTLSLQGGVVEVSGSLTAPGGRVEVLGSQVGLLGNGAIDVSAETGGEIILKAEGNIEVQSTLNSSSLSFFNDAGAGGEITLKAGGDTKSGIHKHAIPHPVETLHATSQSKFRDCLKTGVTKPDLV